jgi:uncharacterized protein (DUF58 family)
LSRWRYPFSFSITGAGIVYILLVFLIAIFAVNTGRNLLYLVLSLLLSAALASGVVARLSLHAVFVSLQLPENVFEGEKVSIKISLRNQKRWFPALSILVEDATRLHARSRGARLKRMLLGRRHDNAAARNGAAVLQQEAYFPVVPAGEVRAELIAQSFARRGCYHLSGLHLSTRFPFGLFRRGELVSVSGDVIVYPAIREVSSDFHLLPFLPGKLEGKRTGPGESLYAIRKYHEEESARLIHWKATAKTGRLMARQYAREEESEFCLILDNHVAGSGPEILEKFEKAVSLAASLAAHFAHEAADFEYLNPSEHVPRGTGTDHLYRVLRSLAVIQCNLNSAAGALPAGADWASAFAPVLDRDQRTRIFSGKVFKIILTSTGGSGLPPALLRSSHIIHFDQL